jgi:hypothetical protein
MMIAKIIAAVAFPFVLTTLINAQSTLRTASGQKMEGAWIFTFVAADGPAPTNYALTSFSSDGLTTTMANAATPPIPAVQNLGNQISGGLGEWVRIGDKQFRFTQIQLIFKNGVPGGFQRTRVTLTLSDTLDGAVGTAFGEFLDLAGNVVFGGTDGTPVIVTGNRIGIDTSPGPRPSNWLHGPATEVMHAHLMPALSVIH